MKLGARIVVVALVGVVAIGLLGGDPRGAPSIGHAECDALAGLFLCVAITIVGWRTACVSAWWIVPLGIIAVTGGLCGWIAGVEFAGDTHHAARLATAPGKVAFLVAMTTFGMALPSTGLLALVRRRGRAGT